MRHQNKFICIFATLAFSALTTTAAHADPTYGLIEAPGVYFGSGNVNGNFTIGEAHGIELALRAKTFGGATIDGSSGIYDVAAGIAPNRPADKARAAWNYEFSINTKGAEGTEGTERAERNISSFNFRLGVDHDPSAATQFTFVDAANYFKDNNTFKNFGSQNSENVLFGNTPGGPFDAFAPGLYSFSLQAFNRADINFSTPLSQVGMVVRVGGATVPEPTSIALLGLGLLGFAVSRRRSAK